MKPKLLVWLALCIGPAFLRAESVSTSQPATIARESIAPSIHSSEEHCEAFGVRLASFQSEDEMHSTESWAADDSVRPRLEMSGGRPIVDTFDILHDQPSLKDRRDEPWRTWPEPGLLVRGQNLTPPALDPANGSGASFYDDPMATDRSQFVTRSELATLATQWEESVFARIAADPYTRRYGSLPGKGWIAVPETRTVVRFTGFVQANFIHDFQNAGFPYGWFVPGLISTPTDHTPNTEFDPRTSRVVFETHTNSKEVGSVTTLISADFYGNLTGPLAETTLQPRLRQAYVTWTGPASDITFLAGQTWSTYVDGRVWPEILDLQGPNGMTGQRQVVFRGSRSFGYAQDLTLDVSAEQPETAVQNGTGLTQWPDLGIRLNKELEWGHLMGAFIGRQLIAESVAGTGRDSAFGYGLSLSGQMFLQWTERACGSTDNLGPRKDSIQFQVQGGTGTGRYVFDLATTPTFQDAIYDGAAQKLRPLDEFGYLVGYRHWWTDRLRSSFVYSMASIDNLDIQDPNEYKRGTYVLANLGYRLFDRMDLGIEYTYGERCNRNGVTGHANRILLGVNYGF